MLSRLIRTRPPVRNIFRTIMSGEPTQKSSSELGFIDGNNAPRPMFEHQSGLPRLPVPKLDVTVQRYLASVKPLVTPTQFKTTCDAAEDFLKADGPKLQARLEARAADPKIENWFEDWWNEYAYFGYRDPVVIYVSYFFAYNHLPKPTKNTRRAAEIVQAALQFRDLVVSEQLTPETAKLGPMCMSSYKYMFNATRSPTKPSDYVKTYDIMENDFMVVARKNRFFTLPLSHQDGERLSTAELEAQLDKIVKLAGTQADPQGLGILTTQNRDIWCDARNHLIEISEKNVSSLNKLDASAFVLCLDDSSPSSRDDVSRACWHGDGHNRFFDKALQFIVFENGAAGFNGEHSRMDGTPTCRLNDYICSSLAKDNVDHGSNIVRDTVPEPELIEFSIDAKTKESLTQANSAFNELINKHNLKVQAYEGYGKDLIKKFKVGPDAYAQMIIQLAFYLLHGKTAPTYESATTRAYVNGRTEVCRTVSEASVAFTKAMVDPDVSQATKLDLARKAIASHIAYMGQAIKGHGVDRHLLGLKFSIKDGEKTPSLFTDPSYKATSHWNLSTSQLSSEHFYGYGWGEVVPDGYGIAYMVKKNSLNFNVAALRPEHVPKGSEIVPDVPKMHASLKKAADMLRDVFLPSVPAKL